MSDKAKKVVYYLLIISALVTMFTLSQSRPALAWDTSFNIDNPCLDLAPIPYNNPDTDQSFEADIQSLSNAPNLDNQNHSLVMVGERISPTIVSYSIWWELDTGTTGNDQISFRTDQASGNYIDPPNGGWYRIGVQRLDIGTENETWSVSTNSTVTYDPNPGDLDGLADNSCIHKEYNAFYEADWADENFNNFADLELIMCDTLDISCQVARIFNGVVNTFVSVGQAIVEGIAALFIPNSDVMVTIFDTIRANFESQLGFLFYPITFIADTFTSLANQSSCEPNCSVNFGSWFGSDLIVDPLQLKASIPSYYDALINFLRATTVFALIVGYYKKYLEIVRT